MCSFFAVLVSLLLRLGCQFCTFFSFVIFVIRFLVDSYGQEHIFISLDGSLPDMSYACPIWLMNIVSLKLRNSFVPCIFLDFLLSSKS